MRHQRLAYMSHSWYIEHRLVATRRHIIKAYKQDRGVRHQRRRVSCIWLAALPSPAIKVLGIGYRIQELGFRVTGHCRGFEDLGLKVQG